MKMRNETFNKFINALPKKKQTELIKAVVLDQLEPSGELKTVIQDIKSHYNPRSVWYGGWDLSYDQLVHNLNHDEVKKFHEFLLKNGFRIKVELADMKLVVTKPKREMTSGSGKTKKNSSRSRKP